MIVDRTRSDASFIDVAYRTRYDITFTDSIRNMTTTTTTLSPLSPPITVFIISFIIKSKVRVAAGWRHRRVQQAWAVRAGAEERERGVGPPCWGAAAGRPEQLGEPRALQLFEAALGARGAFRCGHHVETFDKSIYRYRAVDFGCWGIVSKLLIHSIGMELAMYRIGRVWPSRWCIVSDVSSPRMVHLLASTVFFMLTLNESFDVYIKYRNGIDSFFF